MRSANAVKDVEFDRNKDLADIQTSADALGLKFRTLTFGGRSMIGG